MITSEVERLIRSLVEATEESMIDPKEVKKALCDAFNEKRKSKVKHEVKGVIDEFDALPKSEISERIRKFVVLDLPSRVELANNLLSGRKGTEFSVTALLIYYQLAQKYGGNVNSDEWMELIVKKTGYAKATVHTKLCTELKRCLTAYMDMRNHGKRIKYVMNEFYRQYMLEW